MVDGQYADAILVLETLASELRFVLHEDKLTTGEKEDKHLYQGNLVKVVKASLRWFGQIGTVVDPNDKKYPNYSIKLYFPKYEVYEYFTCEQLEKL